MQPRGRRRHSEEQLLDLIDKGAGIMDFNYYLICPPGVDDSEIQVQVEVMCQMILAGFYGERE